MTMRRIVSFQTQLQTQNQEKKNKFLKKQVPDNENIVPNSKRLKWRVFISATISYRVCFMSVD